MTREEAKDYIREWCPYDRQEEIIKALEQEPCEDCISRQAVINGIDNYIEKVQSTGAKDDFISFEELVVKVLPPVTPKPKTDMLDKIRAEIETKYGQCDICEYFENYDYEENDISEYRPIA